MTTTIAKRQNGQPSVTLGNVVDNIFQNSLRRFFDGNFPGPDRSLTTGFVPVNIRETDQHYEMDVIVPGCKKEDFSIQVSDNVLTIALAQKEQDQEQEKNEKTTWERNEFVQRSFSRTFTLDDTIDTNAISAGYTDGILRLVLPRNEKAKPVIRTIGVQ